jgi:hypothetical protein
VGPCAPVGGVSMILLAAYVGALILGGGLLAASAVLGGHGHDADHDVDHDVDHDAAAHDVGDVHLGAADAIWLPVLSIRFWTFFLAFFGLTGSLLEAFRKLGLIGAPPAVVAVLAAVVGLGAGYAIARILRSLKQERISSEVLPETDYPGKAGEVLLDVAPGDPGMVRLDVKGVSIDVPALAADADLKAMRRGSKVIVLSYKDGKVSVAPFETGEAEGVPERTREPSV